MESITEQLNQQPFFVVNDVAHTRMLEELRGGQRFVKSFVSICPHSNVSECKCPFSMNILDKDGMMVRVSKGVVKPVLSISQYRDLIQYAKSNK